MSIRYLSCYLWWGGGTFSFDLQYETLISTSPLKKYNIKSYVYAHSTVIYRALSLVSYSCDTFDFYITTGGSDNGLSSTCANVTVSSLREGGGIDVSVISNTTREQEKKGSKKAIFFSHQPIFAPRFPVTNVITVSRS